MQSGPCYVPRARAPDILHSRRCCSRRSVAKGIRHTTQRERSDKYEVGTHSVSLLDCRSICNGIREGNTELDDIRASLLHREHHWHSILDCRIPSSHESDKGGLVLIMYLFIRLSSELGQ